MLAWGVVSALRCTGGWLLAIVYVIQQMLAGSQSARSASPVPAQVTGFSNLEERRFMDFQYKVRAGPAIA
jgi:hypothetical protein